MGLAMVESTFNQQFSLVFGQTGHRLFLETWPFFSFFLECVY